MSWLGASLLVVLLMLGMIEWGTAWGFTSLVVALAVAIFEWAAPHIPDNDIDGKPRRR
jgi:hypothetical protein